MAYDSETPTTQKAENVLVTARQRAKVADDGWSHNFEVMEEDVEFLHGDQWPEKIKNDRETKGRPLLTFNKLPSMLDQLVGDERQSRPQITVIAEQDDNKRVVNQAGTKDYSKADIYAGMIRNIEYVSRAGIAYDTAFEHSAGWGLGWFQITTQYADDDTFDQDLRIKRIRNWRAVLADPMFEEPDGSDMMYCFYFTKLHKDEFKRRWPGKECVDTSLHTGDEYSLWYEEDYVRIAEYYDRVPVKKTLHLMNNGEVYAEEDLSKIADELAQQGIESVRSRVVDTYEVIWRKISGVDILEEQKTVFTHIPMIPVLGKELVIKGKVYYRGSIRHAKDAQRMYNYSRTAQIERVALEPKAPFVLTKKQIKGFEDMWDTANTENHPYLLINDTQDGYPQRQFPAQVSNGDTQLSLQAADDIKATMGMFDASLGAQGNETSGKAIMARQREGDTGNYAFTDNLARSISHAGKILIRAIPKIYDTERQVRIRFPDDTEDFVRINQTIVDEQTGEPVTIHDISTGKYDVRVKVGPSYTTLRQEALEQMANILQSNPELWNVIGDLLAKNMDWPGADEFAKRLRKMVPPNLLDSKDVNEEPPPEIPPTPDQLVEMENQKAKQMKAEADKMKAQADMMQAVEKINNLEESIKDAVANAVAEAFLQMAQPANLPRM